jgi:hypothetical protein
MEPDWSNLIEPPPPKPRSLGSKIAIGIGGSLLVWVGLDLLLSIFSPLFIGGLVVVALGVALRGNMKKQSQQLQIVLLLASGVVGWVVLAYLFSFFSYWVIILLTIALAAVVYVKEHQKTRRQRWLDQGCCGGCGYDLRATPDRCPECGRDTTLDEPTWRKLRREWGHIKPAEPEVLMEAEPTPEPVAAIAVPTILKTPDFHEGPIPLEGDELESPKSD